MDLGGCIYCPYADRHVQFMRSANDVILAEDTIGPQFFYSVQVMQSGEVLLATEGPPHPQHVALAISRAPRGPLLLAGDGTPITVDNTYPTVKAGFILL